MKPRLKRKIRPVDFAKVSKLWSFAVSRDRVCEILWCETRFCSFMKALICLKLQCLAGSYSWNWKSLYLVMFFCYIMENYPLAVLNLHKTLPAKNWSKKEKSPFFYDFARFRGFAEVDLRTFALSLSLKVSQNQPVSTCKLYMYTASPLLRVMLTLFSCMCSNNFVVFFARAQFG